MFSAALCSPIPLSRACHAGNCHRYLCCCHHDQLIITVIAIKQIFAIWHYNHQANYFFQPDQDNYTDILVTPLCKVQGDFFNRPPLFSTKMKNGEQANHRLSEMKDFMEQQLRLALWPMFISIPKNSPCTSFHSWIPAEQSCNSFQSVSQLRNMALSTAEYSISPASLS